MQYLNDRNYDEDRYEGDEMSEEELEALEEQLERECPDVFYSRPYVEAKEA